MQHWNIQQRSHQFNLYLAQANSFFLSSLFLSAYLCHQQNWKDEVQDLRVTTVGFTPFYSCSIAFPPSLFNDVGSFILYVFLHVHECFPEKKRKTTRWYCCFLFALRRDKEIKEKQADLETLVTDGESLWTLASSRPDDANSDSWKTGRCTQRVAEQHLPSMIYMCSLPTLPGFQCK